MPFFNTPNMPADPIDGFFAGFTSIFARFFIGWAAIFLACALCYICAAGLDGGVLYAWALGSIGMIFYWATYGGWFVLGLASLVTIFFCLWSFVNDTGGKFTFFLMFTAGVIYFFPIDLAVKRWMSPAITYAIIAACYWFLPGIIAAIIPQPAGEIEVVPPLAQTGTPLHPEPDSFDHTSEYHFEEPTPPESEFDPLQPIDPGKNRSADPDFEP